MARELRCTDHQLKGIKTARFAIGMRLAMKIVLWLERPASAFIHAAEWQAVLCCGTFFLTKGRL